MGVKVSETISRSPLTHRAHVLHVGRPSRERVQRCGLGEVEMLQAFTGFCGELLAALCALFQQAMQI